MSYHEHDGEWEYCLCDEDEQGLPIRESQLRKQNRPIPRPRKASGREPKPKGKAA